MVYSEQLITGLRSAIRGRDAFPCPQSCPAKMDREHPERPLPPRPEEQGSPFYLHAYCTIAEANRTFRLDRVHDWPVCLPDPTLSARFALVPVIAMSRNY